MRKPTDLVDFRRKLTSEFPNAAWALEASPAERFTMVGADGLLTEVLRDRVMTMQLKCTILRQAKLHSDSASGYGDFHVTQSDADRSRTFRYHFVLGDDQRMYMNSGYEPLDRSSLPDIIEEATKDKLLLDPAVAAAYIASILSGEHQAAIETGQQHFAEQNGLAIIDFTSW